MPAAPNFSGSADWMTQYTYLPRTASPATCASVIRCAATPSRGTLAAGFAAGGADRFIGRRSFLLVVFLAMGRYTPGRWRRATDRLALPAPINSARSA